jgi:hypothetical protein
MHTKCSSENLKERDPLEDPGVDEKTILECVFGKQGGKVWNWMHLAQDKDQWRTVVNTAMNIWVL